MPEVRLTVDDAVELAELLEFVCDWLNRPASAQSLEVFGGAGWVEALRSDLARFVFVLGGTGAGIEAPW